MTHVSPLSHRARILPRLPIAARVRWRLFRGLERLVALRPESRVDSGPLDLPPVSPLCKPFFWLFASTIGELNAIEPLVRAVRALLPQMQPVLITNGAQYRDGYASRYPDAIVVHSDGTSAQALQLARRLPPKLLIVAEIPCLPSDAPCRFSPAFVFEARRRGAITMLANGWLYHHAPACRIDALERRWLQRDYLNAFDLLCVQSESTRESLLGYGADPGRLVVTGNLKFDAVYAALPQAVPRSPRMLAALRSTTRPVIVAGCVTNKDKQVAVFHAFRTLLDACPDALLVMAPRHPEVAERIRFLEDLLQQTGLDGRFRTRIDDEALADDVQVLILDTIGELRDFYAVADVTYVGLNHNVLEPLAYDKPVHVLPGWEPSFPSYAVYRLLCDAGVLHAAADEDEMAAAWIRQLQPGGERRPVERSRSLLASLQGATDRHLRAMQPLLDAAGHLSPGPQRLVTAGE